MSVCAVGFADATMTAPCQRPVVTEIRARMPGQDWSPWLPACRFHADAIQGSMDADCSCGECPAAVESRPIEATGWTCEAYPPEAAEFGAICYFADRGKRNCATAQECAASVAGARQVMFQRMNELAAHNPGDETWKYLAETFTSPGQLLGGGDPPPPDPDGGGLSHDHPDRDRDR